MRPARQPTEYIFGAGDCQGERSYRSIERRADESASAFDQRADACKKDGGVGDVLDGFERQHGAEALTRLGHRFGGGDAIFD
jgi:hypothetical protein